MPKDVQIVKMEVTLMVCSNALDMCLILPEDEAVDR